MICGKDQRKFHRLVKWVALGLVTAAAPVFAVPGQADRDAKPWEKMDYGQFQCCSFFANSSLDPTKLVPENQKYWSNKGMAIHLGDADHPAAIIFDTAMLRYVSGWTGDFLKLNGVVFSGKHGQNPSIAGKIAFETSNAPGWAKDGTDWTDPRALSEYFEFPEEKAKREAAHQPPLPGEPAPEASRANGAITKAFTSANDKTILSYSIGDADVLDMPSAKTFAHTTLFTHAEHRTVYQTDGDECLRRAEQFDQDQ